MDNRAEQQVSAFELDWENPPQLKDLKLDYTNAKGHADSHKQNVKHWLNVRNIEGNVARKKRKNRSSITPRLVRKQNEWRYSSLSEPFLSSKDLITAEPVTFEDVQAAKQNELILNNQFTTKMDRVAFFDEYIRTLVDEGTALLRTGWESETRMEMVEEPMTDPYQAQMALAAGYPPVQMVEKEVTVKNHPTVEVVPYTNYIIDPTCMGKLENAKFVIISFDTSLSELKKSGIDYRNLDVLEAMGNDDNALDSEHNEGHTDDTFMFGDAPRKQLIGYEYWGFWDISGEGIVEPIVATWVGETLVRMERNPFPDEALPFVSVQYMPVRNELYGEPDAALLEDNQQINGVVMRGAIDIMARSSNGQRATRRGALDVTNKLKMERGENFEFNADASPADVFHMEKFQELPNSVFSMTQMQNQEAESLSGIKAFNSGITGKALGEQGVGIKSALDATSKREVGVQRRLAEGIIKVARKFMSMNAEWLSEEEIVRISNDEFVPVRRDDLAGFIDISLTISTPEADNEKAQELSFMLQTIGPNSDPGEVRIIRAKIARLRNMPDLAKQIESYEPPPPTPEQIQMQQLEIAKVEAEVAKIHAEAEESRAKAAELNAKVEMELAKARDYNNRADQADLDFVEQETGVKHARELDIEAAKQNGQLRLEGEKAKNKPSKSST